MFDHNVSGPIGTTSSPTRLHTASLHRSDVTALSSHCSAVSTNQHQAAIALFFWYFSTIFFPLLFVFYSEGGQHSGAIPSSAFESRHPTNQDAFSLDQMVGLKIMQVPSRQG